MPSTRKFSELRDKARADPVRARRVDEAKTRAVEEQATYRLAELRQALAKCMFGVGRLPRSGQESLMAHVSRAPEAGPISGTTASVASAIA